MPHNIVPSSKVLFDVVRDGAGPMMLDGDIGLQWRAGGFNGVVQNVLYADIALVDEFGKVFWAVSSSVEFKAPESASSMRQSLTLHLSDIVQLRTIASTRQREVSSSRTAERR